MRLTRTSVLLCLFLLSATVVVAQDWVVGPTTPISGGEVARECAEVDAVHGGSITNTLFGPGKRGQCSGYSTDTDGRNPLAAGCLTHWQNPGCGGAAIGWRWDICTSATNLTEVFTLDPDTKSCQTHSVRNQSCEDWLDEAGNKNGIADECPPNKNAVCASQPLNCGGIVEQVGICACA